MTGAQDRRFADAVRSFLSEPGGLRLEVIPNDWLHVKLTGQIAVQTTAGVLTVPVDKVVTAKLPDTNADARIHELARLRMCESFTYEQLLVPARSNDTVALRRQLIDYIGAGERQPSPDPVTRKSQPFATRGAVIPEPGLRAAAVDAIPEVRQIIWKAITAASNRGTLTTFEKHINAVYRSEGLRWAATWAWEAETKFKALAIVLSRPEFIEHGMRTVDLAACLSMEVRAVNQISERSRINHRVHPPCLSRPGGWGGYGSGNLVDDDRRVSVLRCERPGCDGLMNALLPVPEVLALDAMVVCSTCARAAAGSNKLRFPTFYLDWAALRLAQFQGDWVPCAAPGCTADTGAGPGMTWAWASSDCDPMHDACRPGASLRRRRGRPPRAAQAR